MSSATTRTIRPTPPAATRGIAATRVALAGCGVVGGAMAELLAGREDRLRLARVLVRDRARRRPAVVVPGYITTSLAAFLEDDAAVVAEALGGIEPALEIALATLRRGAHFVTANKALVARHGPELETLAAETGARFRFEGAVGGGVPILRALRDAFRPIGIRSIRGVLNGTCNFVLGRMEEGVALRDAVRGAQRLGYAEADPTRDLDGRDAEDKLRILAWVAWRVDPARLEVNRSGLLPDPAPVLREARRRRLVARLIGECRLEGPTVVARVGLELVEPGSELAGATGPDNRIAVETGDGQRYLLGGPGAGGPATAAAVLGDLLEVARSGG